MMIWAVFGSVFCLLAWALWMDWRAYKKRQDDLKKARAEAILLHILLQPYIEAGWMAYAAYQKEDWK